MKYIITEQLLRPVPFWEMAGRTRAQLLLYPCILQSCFKKSRIAVENWNRSYSLHRKASSSTRSWLWVRTNDQWLSLCQISQPFGTSPLGWQLTVWSVPDGPFFCFLLQTSIENGPSPYRDSISGFACRQLSVCMEECSLVGGPSLLNA